MKVLFFWADYCGACHYMIDNVIPSIENQHIQVTKIDAMFDRNTSYSILDYHLKRLPCTIIQYSDGSEYARYYHIVEPGVIVNAARAVREFDGK